MKQNSILTCLMVFYLLALTACSKKLDIESSAASPRMAMWQTYDDAKAGLVGIYGLTRAALAENNAHWMYGELRKGDFTASTKGGYLDAIIGNNLNKSYPEIIQLTNWRRFYAAIDGCNTFIENAQKCKADLRYSELNCKVDIAQAHLLRAFNYFYISRIWGDVPLIVNATKDGNTLQVARTPQKQVLNFCISEIRNYMDSLPTEFGGNDKSKLGFNGNYYGESWNVWGNAFWGYYQCVALLAEIYAWMGDYQNAYNYSYKFAVELGKTRTKFIETSEVTSLLAGTRSVFYSNGIPNNGSYCYQVLAFPYRMANRESGPSGVGHLESLTLANPYVARNRPDLYITRDTISQMFYSVNDARNPYQFEFKNYGTVYFTNYYNAIPVFSKFRNMEYTNSPFTIFGSCIPIARFEGIYLIRAEAQYVLGNYNDAWAVLNEIRKRRGLNPWLVSGSKPEDMRQLLVDIFLERRRELVGEGNRWYDQVRFNKIMRTDPAFNELIDRGGIYWPVAQEVMDKNPLIEQNPYWK
ncbi:RagB/SusD family nutrient uptake outer membrane protein [Niabella pedocola]|uniref:RagB/SusD family nutrient uptake outer membrane protein n=1 Tax=Niabella pedocola TaxID=1752077 RepID=A0ABS8PN39_9BACT|nr:RagB/SusD family nutrient uptake outer membrane protein [Niabella pedocola]MCD2422534.1 RagB/SusD family nutrient uptake outer membrane protein [Niabella pedocola]